MAGCGVNPIPEPPVEPSIDGPIAVIPTCPSCLGEITVTGNAGDADSVWAVNLDGDRAPVIGSVDEGMFMVSLQAVPGDEVRFQARRADMRSRPVDLIVVLEGEMTLPVRPFDGCWSLPLEQDVAGATTIDLSHDCGDTLMVDRIALHPALSDGVALEAPQTPLDVTAGAAFNAAVTPSGSFNESILLIQVGAPSIDRRAITLFGR